MVLASGVISCWCSHRELAPGLTLGCVVLIWDLVGEIT